MLIFQRHFREKMGNKTSDGPFFNHICCATENCHFHRCLNLKLEYIRLKNKHFAEMLNF